MNFIDNDPRGPRRTIKAVHIDPKGGSTKVEFNECTHVVDRVNHFSYRVGDRDRCFACRESK